MISVDAYLWIVKAYKTKTMNVPSNPVPSEVVQCRLRQNGRVRNRKPVEKKGLINWHRVVELTSNRQIQYSVALPEQLGNPWLSYRLL